jgi:hypothetical protein
MGRWRIRRNKNQKWEGELCVVCCLCVCSSVLGYDPNAEAPVVHTHTLQFKLLGLSVRTTE